MKIDLNAMKDVLLSCEKPSRYTGGEFGSEEMPDSDLNFCMCLPDVYEVGMSNLGIKIVAKSLTDRGFCVDRCFAPWVDFGKALRENHIPLYSLQKKKPLAEFDMIGFSLQYELSYTNLLYMLDLAGIPLLRTERDEKYPVIVAGGPCTVNPEPMADFVDIFFIGDGEENDAEVAALYVKFKKGEIPDRHAFLEAAAKVPGVYVPALMEVEYNDDHTVRAFHGITHVKKAMIPDLDKAVYPDKLAVPNCEAVHDRVVIEVMRGCYRGCRFCQAGFIYRPVRPRGVDTLTKQACSLIRKTGYDEVSMNSLSTGDYPHLRELIRSLKAELPENVTLALPSLRVDSFDSEFAQDARRSSLTFAPEAGTQRLRDVINKDVTLEEILTAVGSAFDMGYYNVKLYFMLGLPTETDEDLLGIADIAKQISALYYSKKRKKQLRISISCATFIPKPFTPFQWERQASAEEIEHKQQVLREALRMRGVSLSWTDYFQAALEAMFARGDRRTGKVLLAAYKNGCIFDGWAECFSKEGWQNAFAETGVYPTEFTRAFAEEEILPWDFVDVLVTKEFYLRERRRAYQAKVTGSCMAGCKGCGIQREFTCHIPQNECPGAKKSGEETA